MAALKLRGIAYVSAVEKPERLVLLLAAVLAAGSCGPKRVPPTEPALAASAADLAPEASPGETASLRLGKGGAEFAVDLRGSRKGPKVGLELLTGGETLEREGYEANDDGFRVTRAGDDVFVPPIDLVRYPARTGGRWEWRGKVAYAGRSRDARATVAVARDGGEIRSEVALFVATDAGQPELRRSLTFWFRKGKGVARRRFGDVSERFPQGETWPP